ncbi:MAG: HAD family phosphatase [Deltaproteobacteria bacterium]|jgi:HAD superfamily hydrolase (TIGR01509 family)|nr:HAD family phosphatase [Deltaproteobacteria bacterium]
MKKKLIIWDFDGVISDTEHLWINVWQTMLNEKYNLNWSFAQANQVLGGIAPKTKIARLKSIDSKIEINQAFLQELESREALIMEKGLKLVEGVEDIFKLKQFQQCIATGGNIKKTERKMALLNLAQYFPPAHVFSAELVKYGKPEPELFLFAAESMGFKPEACIVIEDSLAGLTAGLKAGMLTIAFVGCQMNNTPAYIQQIKELGIKCIFDNMSDVQKLLIEEYKK